MIHLGDYIYEYGMGGYATEEAVEMGRALADDNNLEIIRLDDYRKRYALYRLDAGFAGRTSTSSFYCGMG